MIVAVETESIQLFFKLVILTLKPMIGTITKWLSSNFNPDKAEKYNGWAAMIGIISGIGAYAITGQIIPGFF